jgi:hypothetical protein
LKVQIHSIGSYEERSCKLDRGLIGNLISSDIIQTGLDDFAVIPVPNTRTSDRATGIDDYTNIDTIICDIMVRLGQIDRILDKHANPSMQGSDTALEKDPLTGEYRVKAGSYFAVGKDEAKIEYITWEGQLVANFKQIENLLNNLYVLSEMGGALLGDMSQNAGQIPSGTAMRRSMMSPLAKVSRIRVRMDYAVKKALRLCSQLGGQGVKELTEAINITWKDGLPTDPLEDAKIMQIRTGNKATISQLSAIKLLDNYDEEGADTELSMILADEEVANAPFSGLGSGGANTPPPLEGG